MRLNGGRLALTLVLLLHSTAGVFAKGESSDTALLQGKRLLQQKKYAQAVTAFTTALNKDSKLKQGFLLRGDCEQQLKKYEDAAADYSQYSILAPSDPAGFVRLSKSYASQGKNNLAVSYMGKAILLSPRDASLYSTRASLHDKLGQKALAADDRNVASTLRHAPARRSSSAFSDLKNARNGGTNSKQSQGKQRANQSN